MKSPRELGLPFDSWRSGQRLAIRTALHAKTKNVVIQSPTGSGKSTIATGIVRNDDDQRQVILTASKGLEDQYSTVYDFLYDVRGMGNYPCLAARVEFATDFARRTGTIMCDEGPCRSGAHCTLKENGCTYFDAVRNAIASKAPLTNYPYWFAMRRFGRGLGYVKRVVCDEAHALPEELMSAHQIKIPLGLLDGKPPRTWKRWRQWAASHIDEIKPKGDLPVDTRHRVTRLVESLQQLAAIDETWAWDVGAHAIVFEPTIPKRLMPLLADMGNPNQQIVYLSATITPATLKLLGIPDAAITFKAMKSRFDPTRRPVYLVKTVRVDNRWTSAHTEFWMMRIDKIIKGRLDRKGIIHSISYDRAWYILKHSKYRHLMILPKNSDELKAKVAQFRRQSQSSGAILISPSVMTGWDFPYTDCEYQIVTKVPFPDTRSNIMRARVEGTTGYREDLTMRTLVQACGRNMRADDDRGETFIIDDHARWFLPLAEDRGLSPQWFADSVQYVSGVPPTPPRLAIVT